MKLWVPALLKQTTNIYDLSGFVSSFSRNIEGIFSNKLTYKEHFKCFTAYNLVFTAGVDLKITHNLGVLPSGFIVIKVSNASIIYAGNASWTSSDIYLRASINCSANIIVLGE